LFLFDDFGLIELVKAVKVRCAVKYRDKHIKPKSAVRIFLCFVYFLVHLENRP